MTEPMCVLRPCSVVSYSETPWAAARQAPLSMGFSRQEYWYGLPFPSPGNVPDQGIKPVSPALAGRVFTPEPPGKPRHHLIPVFFPRLDLWGPRLCLRNGFQHQARLSGVRWVWWGQRERLPELVLLVSLLLKFVFLFKGSFNFSYINDTRIPSRCKNIQTMYRESEKPFWETVSQPVTEGGIWKAMCRCFSKWRMPITFDLAVLLLGIYLTGRDHMASTRSAQVILITVMFVVAKTTNLPSVY